MMTEQTNQNRSAEKTVRDIRRIIQQKKRFASCWKVFEAKYRWPKEFLEAGKKRLARDAARDLCAKQSWNKLPSYLRRGYLF